MSAAAVTSPVRDHVLAVLEGIPGTGLRIDEVAARMPLKRSKVLRPCGDSCPALDVDQLSGRRRVVEHHSSWHVVESHYHPAEILRVLTRLERDGLVRSVGRIGGPVSWSLSGVGAMDRLGWLVVDAKPKEMYL
ncbi:hypothetical protein BKG82_26355 [Mycobacteroides chelonae]|uniref:Uncharacterized protein n=1 Tax=Mycobacteroides chelonae TaxID=1774 RepID=A0A1S1LIM3_MYCCH|nr:hypothetical protein [Mycobacteroides chelonae]OHU47182.1 hypothetical protein BKG82_26355 [Mycobacteroides chelonae]